METEVLVFPTHVWSSCEHIPPLPHPFVLTPSIASLLVSLILLLTLVSPDQGPQDLQLVVDQLGRSAGTPPSPSAQLVGERTGGGWLPPKAGHYCHYGASVGGLRRLEASLIPLPLQCLALTWLVE